MTTLPKPGTFVPFHARPRGKQSARVGWVVAEGGCHIWQGALDGKGYGLVGVGLVGARRRMRLVHRVRYEREVGPIPEGMVLDHFFCDNGPGGCCNPEHVRPVSHRENTLRGAGITAQQAAQTHCLNGHPLTGDNLRSWDASHGERKCLACARVRDRARRAKKRATLAGDSHAK